MLRYTHPPRPLGKLKHLKEAHWSLILSYRGCAWHGDAQQKYPHKSRQSWMLPWWQTHTWSAHMTSALWKSWLIPEGTFTLITHWLDRLLGTDWQIWDSSVHLVQKYSLNIVNIMWKMVSLFCWLQFGLLKIVISIVSVYSSCIVMSMHKPKTIEGIGLCINTHKWYNVYT